MVVGAYDLQRDRPVAIKLSKGLASEDRLRFLREARSLARIGHPGVVSVYDVGITEDEVSYLVMERLDGGSLEGTSWAPGACAAALASVASALDAVHAAGMVHRDVKPANLLRRDDGSVALADFGLARSTAQGATVTATGVLLGTPDYMAPELWEGQPATAASDQYALAMCAAVLLHGRRIVPGETPQEVAAASASGRFSLPAGFPSSLADVLSRSLRADPEQRFPDCTALARALREVADAAPPVADLEGADSSADETLVATPTPPLRGRPTPPSGRVSGVAPLPAEASAAGGPAPAVPAAGAGADLRRDLVVALVSGVCVFSLVVGVSWWRRRPAPPAVAAAPAGGPTTGAPGVTAGASAEAGPAGPGLHAAPAALPSLDPLLARVEAERRAVTSGRGPWLAPQAIARPEWQRAWRDLLEAQARWVEATGGQRGPPPGADYVTRLLRAALEIEEVARNAFYRNFKMQPGDAEAFLAALPRFQGTSEQAFGRLLASDQRWGFEAEFTLLHWVLVSQCADPEGVARRLRRRVDEVLEHGGRPTLHALMLDLTESFNRLHDHDTVPCDTRRWMSAWILRVLLDLSPRPPTRAGHYAMMMGKALEAVLQVAAMHCREVGETPPLDLVDRGVSWLEEGHRVWGTADVVDEVRILKEIYRDLVQWSDTLPLFDEHFRRLDALR